MYAAADCEGDQLQNTSSAPQLPPTTSLPPALIPTALPNRTGIVSISAETYARLLSLADQAPLEALALTPRTLARAKTLGYNRIGQIRGTPTNRLLADLGEDRADELKRALYDFGMRQHGSD
jgi:hypothetical protein